MSSKFADNKDRIITSSLTKQTKETQLSLTNLVTQLSKRNGVADLKYTPHHPSPYVFNVTMPNLFVLR